MCGFSGIYRFDGRPVKPETIERMLRSTVHRGPDDQGTLVRGPVGLAHNRLSILDLSVNGHQPMQDAESGAWIVYNGEIYNYREIRKTLEDAGFRFRSSGDTEVILAAYRHWGKSCLDRFNGMFAFAIFDERADEMFLARDRIGIKPLYYYCDGRQLVFASETKAILLADDVPREIRREALPEFVAFRYLANGRTLFRGISELKPGYSMEVRRSGIQLHRYWDVPNEPAEERTSGEWMDGLREQLERSVGYQLISDVPVGCALSGGVDSSLVTALACKSSISSMKTFSIGFDDPNFDERDYARRAAEKMGVENDTRVLSESEFYEALPRLIWHMDEPINHPNSVGIWLLAKLARPKVTVLLTGEGGDELFGGYGRFRTVLKYRRLCRAVPGLRGAARLFPTRAMGRRARIGRELRRDDDGRMIWSSAFLPSQHVALLLGDRAVEAAEAERRTVLESAPAEDLIGRHLYLEQKTYLVSALVRADKMCMAESLENRVPFLDHHVVEYANRMPASLKVDLHQGKIALFSLAGDEFGSELFQRPKSGFGLPTSYFLGRGLGRLKELILSRSFRDRGLMDPAAVESLVRLHESGGENLAEALWALAGLELWARTFVDHPGVVQN